MASNYSEHSLPQKRNDVNQVEDLEGEKHFGTAHGGNNNRGDRALAIIGNERVALTEEDVRAFLLTEALSMKRGGANDDVATRTSGFDARRTEPSLSS
jgi:hypothetical protein